MNKEALIKDLNEVYNLVSDHDTTEAMERLELVISEVKQLHTPDVDNCLFEAYAVFCIECDRKGMIPIKYKDYLNLG